MENYHSSVKKQSNSKGRAKAFSKYTFRSSVQHLRENTLGRYSETVPSALPSTSTLLLCAPADGNHLRQQPCSLSAQSLFTHKQDNFSQMQMTAGLSGPSCVRWAGPLPKELRSTLSRRHPRNQFRQVMSSKKTLFLPELFQAVNATIPQSNPTFPNCGTAKRYQFSPTLAAGKTHVTDWKLRKLKKVVEWCCNAQHKEIEA